jgi:hypothetical protein
LHPYPLDAAYKLAMRREPALATPGPRRLAVVAEPRPRGLANVVEPGARMEDAGAAPWLRGLATAGPHGVDAASMARLWRARVLPPAMA